VERYNRHLQQELRSTSFAGPCNSWYEAPDGRITDNRSGSVAEYRQRTAALDLADFELVPVGG
jgi:hypothetical protein